MSLVLRNGTNFLQSLSARISALASLAAVFDVVAGKTTRAIIQMGDRLDHSVDLGTFRGVDSTPRSGPLRTMGAWLQTQANTQVRRFGNPRGSRTRCSIRSKVRRTVDSLILHIAAISRSSKSSDARIAISRWRGVSTLRGGKLRNTAIRCSMGPGAAIRK